MQYELTSFQSLEQLVRNSCKVTENVSCPAIIVSPVTLTHPYACMHTHTHTHTRTRTRTHTHTHTHTQTLTTFKEKI